MSSAICRAVVGEGLVVREKEDFHGVVADVWHVAEFVACVKDRDG